MISALKLLLLSLAAVLLVTSCDSGDAPRLPAETGEPTLVYVYTEN